jgi:methenyltetrahydrofolate cyclohydrolase
VRTTFVDGPLAAFLDELASADPLPGAGTAAATVVAAAAACLSMAARAAKDEWEDAAGIAAQTEALRRRALELADENRAAYADALAVLAAPPGERPEQRDHAIERALARSAELPLAIARAAADTAVLGEAIAERTAQRTLGDTVAAVFLAAGAARAAAALVSVNLTTTEGDPLVERARQFAADAADAARRTAEFAP